MHFHPTATDDELHHRILCTAPLPGWHTNDCHIFLRQLHHLKHGTPHLKLPDGRNVQFGHGKLPHANIDLRSWREHSQQTASQTAQRSFG
jgi:hypothetical protein